MMCRFSFVPVAALNALKPLGVLMAVAMFTWTRGLEARDQQTLDAQCQSLSRLGGRKEAIDVCGRAFGVSRSPTTARAMVHALMAGPDAPTVEELGQAFFLAEDTRTRFSQQPWGYAAMCDIAERLGDDLMLQRCFRDLQRVAPSDPETEHARASVRALRPRWPVTMGWILLGAATLATLAHAVWRALRHPTGRARSSALASLAVCLGLAAFHRDARAEPSPDHPNQVSDWHIDEQDPEASIPSEEKRNRSPIEFGYWLQDLVAKGEQASKRGDHLAAVKFYMALAKAVPDRPVSYRRLCDEYNAAGLGDRAIQACGSALLFKYVPLDDYTRYMSLIVTKPGALSRQEVSSLTGLVDHLRSDAGARDVFYDIECAVAARTDSMSLLQECTNGLSATAPASPTTLIYEWTLAVKRGEFDKAKKDIDRAKRMVMPPVSIQRMERETDEAVGRHRRKITEAVLAGLLALIAVGAGLVLWQRRSSPGSVPVTAPAAVGGSPQV
jgi:hypothetical protein